jgi:GTP-binding protein
MSFPQIIIIGRPNVGKSTLFNRLARKKFSIVDSKPGVTRDRLHKEVSWGNSTFELIDTGGLLPSDKETIPQHIKKQVFSSIEDSDLILFAVDGKEGLHPLDEEITQLLRKTGKKIILVVNKIDNHKEEADSAEFYRLGFKNVLPVSATHGLNINELLDTIVKNIPKIRNLQSAIRNRIMIAGHPNVGKSTLINKLLHQERVIVDEVPGTTRDIVEIPFSFQGENFTLVDTSGIRRESKIKEGLEKVAVKKTKRAIKEADIVLFLLDMSVGIVREDLSIGSFLAENAKAVIVLLNKCDLVNLQEDADAYIDAAGSSLFFLNFAPFIFSSGTTGKNLDVILKKIKKTVSVYQTPITKGELAEALKEIKSKRPPKKGVRIYDLKQDHTNPNNIILRTNNSKGIDQTYLRFIANHLHAKFALEGIPLHIKTKSTGFRSKKQEQEAIS